MILDEELFATKEVVHVGQIIGLILADTEMNARNAARHVHVEYESLPCIVSIEVCVMLAMEMIYSWKILTKVLLCLIGRYCGKLVLPSCTKHYHR